MNNKHEHGQTSNTQKCFSTFIGCTVKGMYRGHSSEWSHTVFVFDCGWGLAFNSNGSHWTVSPSEVERELSYATESLRENQAELKGILKLAGRR